MSDRNSRAPRGLENGTPISLEEGRSLIAAAAALEADGFDAADLRQSLARLPGG